MIKLAPTTLNDVKYEFSREANNITKTKFPEMFWLAEPALKSYEERPSEENNFRDDYAKRETDNEYKEVFKHGKKLHVKEPDIPGRKIQSMSKKSNGFPLSIM